MLNKHFFKFLIGFIGMILLGLLGLFLINAFFGESDAATNASPSGEITTDNR